jgi:uncharacterized membrane protein
MEPQTNKNEQVEATEVPASAAPVTEEKKEETKGPSQDMSKYRNFAILGYILPFLFFLPLIDDKTKNVPYVRFHANQQLILLITAFAIYVLSGFLIGPLMMLGYYAMQILNFALLALVVIGVINVYKGESKELPFIGQFKILS